MTHAFFEVDPGFPDALRPTAASVSGWSTEQVHGPAVSGALARATERVADDTLSGMRPVRWTVDLFRPALVLPTTVQASIFRRGRRLALVDAELSQNGKPVARSRALFARPAVTPNGQVWSPVGEFRCPPPEMIQRPDQGRIYHSHPHAWTSDVNDHQGSAHKQTWHFPVPIVAGEEPTPFQMTAAVADVTNLVTNWGSAGIEFINADITLAMSRLPAEMELGLSALDRTVNDGIAIGTAAVFDRLGQLGVTTVVALANPGNSAFGSAPTNQPRLE